MRERRLGAPDDVHPALEDFESNSPSAVPGLLGKLRYVARLHGGHGAYSQWGLAAGTRAGSKRNAPSGPRTEPCLIKC